MSQESDSEVEDSVPHAEKTSIFSYNLEPKRIVPGMHASELKEDDLLLRTAKTMEPFEAEREAKVPNRFGQYFTPSSVMKEEKEPLSYKQALKSSSAEKWLHAMKEEF